MDKEDLIELKKKISTLSEEELKERDKYLRGLSTGEIQGPPVGYSSIDKQWLKYYTDKDIDRDIPQKSIYQYLVEECTQYSNMIALECFGEKITYAEMFQKIDKVATALKNSGVKKGDVVSVCVPNIPEVGYIFYAINKLGAVANMLDPRTDSTTLGRCVADSKSELLITLDSVCPTFLENVDKTALKKIVTLSAVECLSPVKKAIAKTLKKELRVKKPNNKMVINWQEFTNVKPEQISSEYEKNSPAIIAYTGGTTGIPKGVVVSNEAMNAMIIENKAIEYNIQPGDTCISLAPPWTYYGISNNFNVYLHLGITIKQIPMFGPNDLGQLIAKNKPNHIMTVPSALEAMKTDSILKDMDLSFIKTIIVGADRMDPTKEQEANEFLANHNSKCKISKGYGMTEVTAATTYTTENSGNIPNTVGIPFVKESVAVYDDEGHELPTGSKGNIQINGPKNMMTYFGENETKNDEVIVNHEDGKSWINSGDIGHMDENGTLYIDGRSKRMFTKNGFKIFASEVETKILEDERIAQCAVIGVEDASTGFKEKAFITIKEEYLNQTERILDELPIILKGKTYEYEIPDEFEVIEKMPLTGMNKIDFKTLEERENNKGKVK